MKENIILSLLIIIYIIISYFIHLGLFKVKNIILFIVLCIIYLLFTFLLGDLTIDLHIFLRERKTYLDFEHAEESLIYVSIIWFSIAIGDMIIVIIRKILNSSFFQSTKD
jgi:hypothetical protein